MHFFVGDIVFDNYANILLKRCINCTFSYLVHLTEDTVALNTLPLCLKKKKTPKKTFLHFHGPFLHIWRDKDRRSHSACDSLYLNNADQIVHTNGTVYDYCIYVCNNWISQYQISSNLWMSSKRRRTNNTHIHSIQLNTKALYKNKSHQLS